MSWLQIAPAENIPPREGRRVLIGSREIAIFNLGDQFFAVDNMCPHRGGPLSDGIVAGAAVVCPLHAWKINLETGEVQRPADAGASCVRAYATRVEQGVVSVQVPTASDDCRSGDAALTQPAGATAAGGHLGCVRDDE